MKILLLEDDMVLSDIYVDFLSQYFEVEHTYSSDKVLELLANYKYDFYIFDVNVVGISGISLLKELRSFNDQTPTVFITAYQDMKVLKEAFSGGAADFLRKPFELEELLVRIENIKLLHGIDTLIEIEKHIFFDKHSHQLIKEDKKINISTKESELLSYLYSHRNRIISLDEIMQNLWDYNDMPGAETVRTYVKTLRKLIGKEHIVNVRGEGYRYE